MVFEADYNEIKL